MATKKKRTGSTKLPEGFTTTEFTDKNGEKVSVPTNKWVPSLKRLAPIDNYHCPECAFSHSDPVKMQEHLNYTADDPDLHVYGFPGGVNPFTGETVDMDSASSEK